MKPIPFTEFIRPNAEQRQRHIDRPDDIAAMAERLINKGCRFTTERDDQVGEAGRKDRFQRIRVDDMHARTEQTVAGEDLATPPHGAGVAFDVDHMQFALHGDDAGEAGVTVG